MSRESDAMGFNAAEKREGRVVRRPVRKVLR